MARKRAKKEKRHVAKEHKLRVYWSEKERDLMIHWPLGAQTNADGHLAYGVFCNPRYSVMDKFDPSFIEELKSRGYDITTLKFEISPAKGDQRFASERTHLVDQVGALGDGDPTGAERGVADIWPLDEAAQDQQAHRVKTRP